MADQIITTTQADPVAEAAVWIAQHLAELDVIAVAGGSADDMRGLGDMTIRDLLAQSYGNLLDDEHDGGEHGPDLEQLAALLDMMGEAPPALTTEEWAAVDTALEHFGDCSGNAERWASEPVRDKVLQYLYPDPPSDDTSAAESRVYPLDR
jgi:hypothetical protein